MLWKWIPRAAYRVPKAPENGLEDEWLQWWTPKLFDYKSVELQPKSSFSSRKGWIIRRSSQKLVPFHRIRAPTKPQGYLPGPERPRTATANRRRPPDTDNKAGESPLPAEDRHPEKEPNGSALWEDDCEEWIKYWESAAADPKSESESRVGAWHLWHVDQIAWNLGLIVEGTAQDGGGQKWIEQDRKVQVGMRREGEGRAEAGEIEAQGRGGQDGLRGRQCPRQTARAVGWMHHPQAELRHDDAAAWEDRWQDKGQSAAKDQQIRAKNAKENRQILSWDMLTQKWTGYKKQWSSRTAWSRIDYQK